MMGKIYTEEEVVDLLHKFANDEITPWMYNIYCEETPTTITNKWIKENHIKRELVIKKVKFPNESFHEEMEVDMTEFKPDKEFNTQIFGWYLGHYVSIEKED